MVNAELPNTAPAETVGRLAPSPTGGLHLGHARTFLIAWLAARHCGGRVVLRIEDLDASRVRAEAKQSILDDLGWLGLDWDEGPDLGGPHAPYVQSERVQWYQRVLDDLKASEMVYPCTCTRADIARAASAPHPEDEGPSYPGTCSHRKAADAAALGDRPFAWRFRVPPGPITWTDSFLGPTTIDPSQSGGDFIVARHTVGPSYQLAVVVDDAMMGINQVIRGGDLVTSTPRQILL
jgi:glutamyl-tRNA synthetase